MRSKQIYIFNYLFYNHFNFKICIPKGLFLIILNFLSNYPSYFLNCKIFILLTKYHINAQIKNKNTDILNT